jgi:hypothetical protein
MKNIFYIALVISVCFIACKKDFIVVDIDDKTLTVNAPANNLKTSVSQVTFWWEPLDGAEKYNLQIVKPNFTNVAQLITDTNVTGTKLNFSLQPGTYQWRIKATNAGHSTAFQTFNLIIDTTDVLTDQEVLPVAPLSGFVTRDKAITFSWLPHNAASSYSVEISLNNTIVNYSVVNSSPYAYTFSVNAGATYTCSWRVKAINATSVSKFNTPQTFTIDLLPPPAVSTPTYPSNNTMVKDTTELRWNRSGTPDTEYDSLFVYIDASLLNLVRTTTVSATKIKINAINPSNPLPVGTTSASAISYWWRLKSVDKVGNTTGFSNASNFQLVQ